MLFISWLGLWRRGGEGQLCWCWVSCNFCRICCRLGISLPDPGGWFRFSCGCSMCIGLPCREGIAHRPPPPILPLGVSGPWVVSALLCVGWPFFIARSIWQSCSACPWYFIFLCMTSGLVGYTQNCIWAISYKSDAVVMLVLV